VPVTTTVQRCGKVCKPVVVQPVVAATAVATTEVAVPYGKGKGKLLGKGRHLMTIGKGKFLGKGKGMVAPVSIDCDTVCQDVPITTFRTQCQTRTRTVTSCRRDFEQVRGVGGPRPAGDCSAWCRLRGQRVGRAWSPGSCVPRLCTVSQLFVWQLPLTNRLQHAAVAAPACIAPHLSQPHHLLLTSHAPVCT
jgi:hypothetical protein